MHFLFTVQYMWKAGRALERKGGGGQVGQNFRYTYNALNISARILKTPNSIFPQRLRHSGIDFDIPSHICAELSVHERRTLNTDTKDWLHGLK